MHGSQLSFSFAALALLLTGSGCGGGGGNKTGGGSCNNSCASSGATQCSGVQVQTCTADSSGCLAWSAATACPGTQSCKASSGVCSSNHQVTISWAANRESGVNSAGGGYKVAITGQPVIDVPFASGTATPTSTVTTLAPGSYSVTVKAYAALDAQGGSSGSTSVASQSVPITVP